MQYVRMGSTGTQVSRLCLGCMSFGGMADWTLNEDASLPIVRKAVEAGINFFDTADIYSRGQSEEILGRGAEGAEGPPRRDAWSPPRCSSRWAAGPNRGGLSRKHIMQSIDASLTPAAAWTMSTSTRSTVRLCRRRSRRRSRRSTTS